MSKFPIKGLVVPLIFFDLSLFSNPNPNPLTMHCWQTWRWRRKERGKTRRNYMYLHVNLLSMFQDADNVSHDSYTHLLQIFL